MKIKLIHPLWTHIPAILALLAGITFTLWALPLPDPAPLHFNFGGQPDGYGPSWISVLLHAGISMLYIILSMILDEAWARQEKEKTFNWLSLLDDFIAAALAAVQITYVNMLMSSSHIYPFPWMLTMFAGVVGAGIAAILEKVRPHRKYEAGLAIEDVSHLRVEVSRILEAGQPLVYWEAQNPVYSRILATVVPLLMFAGAAVLWAEVPWSTILLALIGMALTLVYGGFRTLVTRDAVTVRMGIMGIPMLRLRTADIASAELHRFSPLKDFGGYGIRFNKEMKAYFLNGERGTKLTTRAGKRYLIGSDHAERLTTIVSAVIG